MSATGLFSETSAHRLLGISKLSRDDMRLLGYAGRPDDLAMIAVITSHVIEPVR
jgi:hypothetical protein